MKRMMMAAMAVVVLACAGFVLAQEQRPLRVCMLSGAKEYRSDQTLAAYGRYLEKNHNVRVSLHVVAKGDDLPGLDQLEDCDVLLIYVRRLDLSPGQVEAVKKLTREKPVIGVRTASHAFQTWLEFDRQILGGSYSGHYADRLARVRRVEAAQDHPVLEGVQPFSTHGKLYKNPDLAADVTVLLRAATDEYSEPVAWSREHDGVRVFYTSLGVPEDFENEQFIRLLTNALFWTARQDGK